MNNPTITIPITTAAKSNAGSVDLSAIGFGQVASDHMFLSEFKNGSWQNPRIEPLRNLSLSPFTMCLHYGQIVFEGMKAFRMKDGTISLFRPESHHERLNKSLQRMCMPEIPYDLFISALTKFVQLETDWFPDETANSFYLRPLIIAIDDKIGVSPSKEYLFLLLGSPAGNIYTGTLKLKLETTYIRAAEGGTGNAKCAGNYAAGLYPTQLAKTEGFDQVLWTDALHRTYIEESGVMNILFIIDGKLITTPTSSGTILEGITRDSILRIARINNITIEERKISYHELLQASSQNKRIEAFGVGTAAVVIPIESINIKGKTVSCYTKPDAIQFTLKDCLNRIRNGEEKDIFHWNYRLN